MSTREERERRSARRERRRHNPLLSSFYGVGAESPTSSEADMMFGDPLDVTSKAFDGVTYVKSLLNKLSLDELLVEARGASDRVRTLDSSMRGLVYENYGQFITVTDTVQELKQKMEAMDGDLARLQAKMDAIDSQSAVIDAALAPNKSQIHALATATDAVDKLVFLLRLPARVQKAVDVGALKAAIRSIVLYGPVVRANTDVPRLAAVAAALDALADDIKDSLRSRLAAVSSMDELGATMDMLMDLGESVDDLRASYLEKQAEALGAALDAIADALPPTPPRDPGAAPPLASFPMLDAIATLHNGFIPPFIAFVDSYRSLFLDKHNADAAGTHGLVAVVRPLFARFFALSKAIVAQHVATGTLLEVIDKVTDELAVVAERVPEAALDDRLDEVVSKALHGHIDAVFSRFRASLAAAIAAAASGAPLAAARDAVASATTSSLASLRPLLSSAHPGINDNMALITSATQVCIQHALLAFRPLITAAAASPTIAVAPLAVLAALAAHVASDTVPAYVDRVLTTLSVGARDAVLDAVPICEDVGAAATELLGTFAARAGWDLAAPILAAHKPHAAASAWTRVEAPEAGTSAWARALVDRLDALFAIVRDAFPDDAVVLADRARSGERVRLMALNDASSSDANTHRRGPSSFESMTLMFEEKLQLASLALTPAATQIALYVAASVCKAWVEAVRMAVFSRAGLRTVATDAAAVGQALAEWVADGDVLVVLLAEVVASAELRATDA